MVAQRLASIIESSQDAIVSKDLNGIITSWNKGAERLFGYTGEEAIGRSVTILIPENQMDEEPAILGRIRRAERVEPYETVRRRKDGTFVDILLTVSPIVNAAGQVIGASKIARDITEQKRAQERQALLLREMNHRIKNLFMLASSIVSSSARSVHNVKELTTAIQGRLNALASAHELTMPDQTPADAQRETQTTLPALLQAIVAPFDDAEVPRVIMTGPDVQIGGETARSFALLMHEFTANAAKHGALSANGQVAVSWSVEEGELRLTWTETGGQPVEGPPDAEGFGSILVHRIMSGYLMGRISRDWNPNGLSLHLSVPVHRLQG